MNTIDDLQAWPIVVVRRNFPIFRRLRSAVRGGLTPGQIIDVTDDEFQSMKNDIIALKVDDAA